MKIVLDLKALSINAAYRCRRFNTPAKKQYDYALALMLPNKKINGPYYRIDYKFFLSNFAATDQQNLLKCLTDAIVRKGIIRDDRYIIDERIRKFPSKRDRMEIAIEGVEIEKLAEDYNDRPRS